MRTRGRRLIEAGAPPLNEISRDPSSKWNAEYVYTLKSRYHCTEKFWAMIYIHKDNQVINFKVSKIEQI